MPIQTVFAPPRLALARSAQEPPLATFVTALSFAAEIETIAETSGIFPQVGWIDPDTGTRWLGLGEADGIFTDRARPIAELPDLCARRLAAIQAPPQARGLLRYFGGIAFDPADEPHADWRSGHRARFVLPRILLRKNAGDGPVMVAVTLSPDPTADGEELYGRFRGIVGEALDPPARSRDAAGVPSLTPIPFAGAPERWERAVRRALDAIEGGALRKVVLSRDFRFESGEPIPPWGLLRRIRGGAARRFAFCFRFGPGEAFVGATPERLVSLAGGAIACDCLAGTGRRGRDPREDEERARSLIASEKDQREHRFVRDGILESLRPVARWLEADARPGILALPKLQHLWTPVRGWTKDGVTIGELITRLHPTPAVGGSPARAALPLIRELEERPRGWYAGPIGWIGRDDADFAVGIRAAYVRGKRLTVIGGAGIVRGSDPGAEWDETARKVASFLSLFTEAAP